MLEDLWWERVNTILAFIAAVMIIDERAAPTKKRERESERESERERGRRQNTGIKNLIRTWITISNFIHTLTHPPPLSVSLSPTYFRGNHSPEIRLIIYTGNWNAFLNVVFLIKIYETANKLITFQKKL